ncbi:hypothetical protein BN1723_007604 [Verticillium longisporum]|uniref:Uncharacterized protein n=1 Tax=Verticillium longisporum TaxID=100787 RepID=A0A0G4NM58_VERLO|nr:hypothetical protein BN1723_007604 [Verticillium longisporum]
MRLNIRVLANLQATNSDLLGWENCPEAIAKDCKSQVARFRGCIQNIKGTLDVQCKRADTLIEQLRDNLSRYEVIAQYRTSLINKAYANSAYRSALRAEKVTAAMHDIAKRTERDTASMHIITLFTLVFLPGTFLGVRH